ncbi:MAG: transglycosylase SLT domain-containing protein [Tidjanibacter sp.]|nr:transglycosylase SLT domain-containing protein [Tidjanibacter sp.]
MTKRQRKYTLIALCALLGCAAVAIGLSSDTNPQTSPKENFRARLALCENLSGYYVISGENYGFPIDLVDSFAMATQRRFEVAGYMPLDSISEAFKRDECDIATILTRNLPQLSPRRHSLPVYSTSYVLISWRGRQFDDSHSAAEIIGKGKVLVDAGFLPDANGADTTATINYEISPASGFKKAELLRQGKCDWFICEKSEAEIICYLNRAYKIYHTFDTPTDISLVFRNERLYQQFAEWFDAFSASDAFLDLEEFYFGDERVGSKYSDLRHSPTRVVGGISVWDEQIRRIALRENIDWRLLSAIAFNESRFIGDAVSSRGAVGLMQLMPIVAVDLKVDTTEVDLADPEVNIALASKHLRRTMRALKFDEQTDDYNRAAITVATYHCGIGRIGEARRAVEETGGDPDSWQDLQEALLNMGSAAYVAEHNIKGGTYRDRRTTIAYVKGVMDKYESYCEALK